MQVKRNFFDIYVAIDWSGAKHPIKSKSISLSWCYSGDGVPDFIKEKLSRQDIADWIFDLFRQGKRAFIGVDCNFSYSETICHEQFGKNFQINDLWAEVESYNHQNDNFYAGGFWESKKYQSYFWTKGTQPEWFDKDKLMRQTEKICLKDKWGHPECPFKLIGAKQVGKGGLSGMRLARYLREKMGDNISIWPFDNNLSSTSIVMAEIYPRLFLIYSGYGQRKVKVLSDLNLVLRQFKSNPVQFSGEFNDHICDAIISAAGLRYFVESLSPSLSDAFQIEDKHKDISQSEGWIFGVNKIFVKENLNHV